MLNTGVSGTAIKDEDDMTSDSATHLATQQSIKAYVTSQVSASDTFLELSDTQGSFTANAVIGTNSAGNATVSTELLATASSNDVTFVVGLTVMVKVCEADVHVTSLFSKVG